MIRQYLQWMLNLSIAIGAFSALCFFAGLGFGVGVKLLKAGFGVFT